jgi:hypothetical protein
MKDIICANNMRLSERGDLDWRQTEGDEVERDGNRGRKKYEGWIVKNRVIHAKDLKIVLEVYSSSFPEFTQKIKSSTMNFQKWLTI